MSESVDLTKTKGGYWALELIDDGRTVRLAFGRTKRGARRSLRKSQVQRIITGPDGLRKLHMLSGLGNTWMPDEFVERLCEHLGIEPPSPGQLNVSQ